MEKIWKCQDLKYENLFSSFRYSEHVAKHVAFFNLANEVLEYASNLDVSIRVTRPQKILEGFYRPRVMKVGTFRPPDSYLKIYFFFYNLKEGEGINVQLVIV